MKPFLSKQNGYVQANSVQSQFTTLSRERESFHRAKEEADEEHKRVQARLQQLKGGQTNLMTKIRAIQEELGTLTRKQSMLKHEQARVERVMQCERKALEDCAIHTHSLEKQERERIMHYCCELGELNEETDDLLQRQINAGIQYLLSAESVEQVLSREIPQSVSKEEFLAKLALMKEAKGLWDTTLFSSRNKASSAIPPHANGADRDTESSDGTEQNETIGLHASRQMNLFYGLDSIGAS